MAVSVEDVWGMTVLGRREALRGVLRPKEEVEIAEKVLTVSEARDPIDGGS